MEANVKLSNSKQSFFEKVKKALKNETFLYILKRILSSCFTAILIIAVVTALIRLLPEEQLYDLAQYRKLKNQGGQTMADNYKFSVLSQYGRYTADGDPRSVLSNIFQYIYWVLPIPKKIPIRWTADYSAVKEYKNVLIYFGQSIEKKKFVTVLLGEKMGISFKVTIISVFFTYLIGYPLGIAMSKKPGGLVDKIGNVFIVLNYAIPALVFYLFMQNILGNPNGVFGGLGLGLLYDENNWKSLVAPIFCMVFLSIPGVIIWLRRFMIDELSSDYVKFARSKGLSENRIMYTHVLRNAIVPLIRNVPATFIGAIVGSYFVEVIWNIPGTGGLLITGLTSTDVPVIQGLTVIYAVLGMMSFLIGDIITVFFDPRIKLKG